MKDLINTLEFDEEKFLNDKEDFKIYNESSFEKMYSKLHEHDFVEVFILLSGDVDYTVENGKYKLKDYDIVVVPPHTLHKLKVENKNIEYKRIVLWISKNYLDELSSFETNLYSVIERVSKTGSYLIRNTEFTFKVRPYLEKVMALQRQNRFGADLLIDNTFRELFIMSNFISKRDLKEVEVIGNPIVLKVTEYISNNLSSDLSLESIAKALDLDPFYISHTFSKFVGTTIHKFVVKKRLNYAKKLIEQDYNVKDLISLAGFNDESHFIQSFKKEFGYTPKQYRSRLINK